MLVRIWLSSVQHIEKPMYALSFFSLRHMGGVLHQINIVPNDFKWRQFFFNFITVLLDIRGSNVFASFWWWLSCITDSQYTWKYINWHFWKNQNLQFDLKFLLRVNQIWCLKACTRLHRWWWFHYICQQLAITGTVWCKSVSDDFHLKVHFNWLARWLLQTVIFFAVSDVRRLQIQLLSFWLDTCPFPVGFFSSKVLIRSISAEHLVWPSFTSELHQIQHKHPGERAAAEPEINTQFKNDVPS